MPKVYDSLRTGDVPTRIIESIANLLHYSTAQLVINIIIMYPDVQIMDPAVDYLHSRICTNPL